MKNVVVQVLHKIIGCRTYVLHIDFFSLKKSGRLPLPSGLGLFLMSEEPEARTFKRFEMIIRI